MKAGSKPMTSGDIEFNLKGERKEIPFHEQESNDVGSWALTDAPPRNDVFVIFKLCDNTKDGGVHIHGEEDVFNPKTKGIERVRCLLGVETIWMKEQKDITPEYVKANLRKFSFPRGAKILSISEKDKTGLEFLRVSNSNIGNKNKRSGSRYEFFEYNPAKQQQEALAKEMLEIEMAIQASKEPVEAMRKHANYLGIIAFDEFGIPKGDEGIRREYIIAAKRNPGKFQKTLGSKEVEVSYLIRKAISENLIDLGGHTGNISWGAGGFIANVPVGRNTHEYLVELALTNSEDGTRFLSRLNDLINKK